MTETESEHIERLLQQSPTTDNTAKKAKAAVKNVAEDVGQQAEKITDRVQSQVQSQVAAQKEKASETLSSVASALRQTGEQLNSNQQDTIATYANKAAAEIEQFSGYLKTHDMNELMDEVQDLARRQPAVFLGGAFALGVLAARFFKSSSPQPRQTSKTGYRRPNQVPNRPMMREDYRRQSSYDGRPRPSYTNPARRPMPQQYRPNQAMQNSFESREDDPSNQR